MSTIAPRQGRHAFFMQRAIELARRGWYTSRPNPRVGCVLVRGATVLGEGWHERAGEDHAEITALAAARTHGHNVRGASVYVTLEPCSHHGKTPPCVQALIDAGVGRVIIGTLDPNPMVGGQGEKRLREAGIEVMTGVQEAACAAINAGFSKRMLEGRPRVRLKLAMSLDGRTAAADGQSQWITGEPARRDVHRLRAESGAVMVGRGTLAADDPALTVRLPGEWLQPLRVVLDSQLQSMTPEARLLTNPGQTLVATASRDDASCSALKQAGAEIVTLSPRENGLDIGELLDELGRREINDVLVEAGSQLAGHMIRANWVDELVVYTAPMLIGPGGRALMQLSATAGLDEACSLAFDRVEMVGQDLKITARPQARTATEEE